MTNSNPSTDSPTDSTTESPSNASEDTQPSVKASELSSEQLRELTRILNTNGTAADFQDELDGGFDVESFLHPDQAPVIKDVYTWEHYKIEHFYTDYDYEELDGSAPIIEGSHLGSTEEEPDREEFSPEDALGETESELQQRICTAQSQAEELADIVDSRTLTPPDDFDEDTFFTTENGVSTLVSRYDLEKEVANHKKSDFEELERYWVNKPFAFVVIYRSRKENEIKYYLIEPHLTDLEKELKDFMVNKLQASIKYAGEDAISVDGDEMDRADVIEDEATKYIEQYGIRDNSRTTESPSTESSLSVRSKATQPLTQFTDLTDALQSLSADDIRALFSEFIGKFSSDNDDGGEEIVEESDSAYEETRIYLSSSEVNDLSGQSVRPEPIFLDENSKYLSDFQVRKLIYYLKRDFVGYSLIDGVKYDINVEDISCDGYDSPVFVYHGDYEQIISNIYHGTTELDDFVIKLAQRSGKGISKRQPQVDCTLPDGSRAQLTLGAEVSDHGTNYTIRQFKDVPFTPVDLINWNTFSLDQMAFLWLAIENHKSLIFAGGTASGKTTSLNAVSLFIPSSEKIVSIEDTREVELPQRNWIASVTRPSFSEGSEGDIDEFDLLEAALRQRPDYIVMGEIRGEEGRTAFQVMSTGHTTYTTFHADSVGEVLKRFTTDPINVSKTMFTALDLVSIQTATRVQGNKVRRNKSLTEINDYNPETDEINVQAVYTWLAENDEFQYNEGANILEDIMFDRGWNREKLDYELFIRRVVIAYLIDNGLNEYTQVAATFQAFMNDPESILGLIANDELAASLQDLRKMESVLIDIDPEKEEMVPRPSPTDEVQTLVDEILDRASKEVFPEYRHRPTKDFSETIEDVDASVSSLEDVTVDGNDEDENRDEEPQETEELEGPQEPKEPQDIEDVEDGEDPLAIEGPNTDSSDSDPISEKDWFTEDASSESTDGD